MKHEKEIKKMIQSWSPETQLTEKELTEAVERFFKFFEVLHKIKQRQKKEKRDGENKKQN